ncbi:OmpA family protein [Hymenobacter pini]|uniref:OmpA family protein n=1 Tax=Hymenobacter pini TaxID=2880879 RepID=UPI001CF157EE|nr:OmpA family protein [Hymenobacter pini]MCA8830627.1 OmpA family protein [Hymenobacter pini]
MLPIPDGLLIRLITLLLVLLATGPLAWAQQPAEGQPFTDARTGYQLTYPRGWQVHEETPAVSFYAGGSWGAAPAVVRFTMQPLPAGRVNLPPLAVGHLDSLWQALTALPQAQVVRLEQHDAGVFQEVRYEYTFADSAARRRVLGRRLWRGGYEFQVEYQAATSQDANYLAAGRQLVSSFVFAGPGLPSRRYADQRCDNKIYGIAALRAHDGIWEDDCRTIHEWSGLNLALAPKVHRKVLPFQSYALAKGFDNCLYSVTKSPTDQPERVYRYNPATRQGEYTGWELPAQGPGNVWISAATDRRGDLYFQTSDAHLLVRVSPATDSVVVVWEADPLRKAAYYPAIGFSKAGTHANFGLDETGKLYEVYSADGALLTVDLASQRPGPELLPLDGLPEQGGYSDVLVEQDDAGRRRLLLAGPKSIFEVDLERRQATRLRRGVYTDLAGCSLFRSTTETTAPPTAPSAATWLGRVLDASTLQPLPQARLQFSGPGAPAGSRTPTAAGEFLLAGQAGQTYQLQAQLAGYFPADTTYRLPAGPSGHDIVLRPLQAGTTLRLDNVQFEQGKAVLLPSSTPDLNRLLALLTATPQLTIELRGHTDNQGDPQLNVQLSEQRVAVVKAYLVSRGVTPERITGLGLGGAEPRASNEREETRRLNRRVEVRVTGGR